MDIPGKDIRRVSGVAEAFDGFLRRDLPEGI
jgi:hypothetical protein